MNLDWLQEINVALSAKLDEARSLSESREKDLRQQCDEAAAQIASSMERFRQQDEELASCRMEIAANIQQIETLVRNAAEAEEELAKRDALLSEARRRMDEETAVHQRERELLQAQLAAATENAEVAHSTAEHSKIRWQALVNSLTSDYAAVRHERDALIRASEASRLQNPIDVDDPDKEAATRIAQMVDDFSLRVSAIDTRLSALEEEALASAGDEDGFENGTEDISHASSNGEAMDCGSDSHVPNELENGTDADLPCQGAFMTLDDLLSHHDEDFVHRAYRTVLARPADPQGLAFHTARLRRGADRLQILSDLQRSGEGRIVNANVPGLAEGLRQYRLRRWIWPRHLIARAFPKLGEGEHITRLRTIENQLGRLLATRGQASPVRAVAGAADIQPSLPSAPPLVSSGTSMGAVDEAVVPAIDTATAHDLMRTPSSVTLGEDRGIALSEWDWAKPSLLPDAWKQDVPLAQHDRVLNILLWSDDPADCSEATFASIAALQKMDSVCVEIFAHNVRCRHSHQSIASLVDLTDYCHADDLTLVIGPNDQVDPLMIAALESERGWHKEFVLFDQYFLDEGRVYPIPFHGIDDLHARYVDYFQSRFLFRTGLISLMAGEKNTAPRDVAQFALHHCRNHPAHKLHLQFPLLMNGELSYKELRKKRSELLNALSIKGDQSVDLQKNTVSAVICTKDCGYLLNSLINSLLSNRLIKDIVIVSNNTSNDYSLMLLNKIFEDPRCLVLKYNKPFNFSEQSNIGAKAAKGDHILFINDDICPINPDWLDILMSDLDADKDRIVGPLLLYPDQGVQHGGMYIGFNGCAGHAFRHLTVPHGAPAFELVAPRRVSCLTGAVMLMKRQTFDALNGFDPLMATMLQDVDLCLRAMFSGVELVFDPRSVLFHMESVTIKRTLTDEATLRRRDREYAHFRTRWHSELGQDRWLNRMIDMQDESWKHLNKIEGQ